MQLTFRGAAQQVTGSCFLFETAGCRFLVDCGLFQGNAATRAHNEQRLPFAPRALDFVVLTHAHLDHGGLLPRLCARGFNGPVYATAATRDLLAVLLADSAWLQQQEAERSRRHGREFTPLYSLAEAQAATKAVRPVRYGQVFEPAAGVRARLVDGGHILGSAIVELWIHEHGETTKVVVSGDLGQPGRPIVRDPTAVSDADVLLLESTYGNRNHRPLADTVEELAACINDALREHEGVVLVPAFAVGRTQEFLYYLNRLAREGRIDPPAVYVDSPMAAEITQITARHFELFDEEARTVARSSASGAALRVRYTATVQESMALNRLAHGAIIVAASGMCDGGRIRHHLRQRLANPHTTVLIVGFQAAGTLGRRLVDRASVVRIAGEEIPVRARIVTLGGFSAHADQAALLDWLGHLRAAPRRLFLVHGEPETMQAFAGAIDRRFGWRSELPAHGEVATL